MAVEATTLSAEDLAARGRTLRRHIIRMTTEAGSGHPSSSLSAVEVVNALFFDHTTRVQLGFEEAQDAAGRLAAFVNRRHDQVCTAHHVTAGKDLRMARAKRQCHPATDRC